MSRVDELENACPVPSRRHRSADPSDGPALRGWEIARLYQRDRYPVWPFVPLALLVAGVGMLASPGSGTVTLADAARGSAIASLLILAFRVWDDLEDRRHDATFHPGRITVRDGATAPLIAVATIAMLLAISATLIGTESAQRMISLGALSAVLLVWYRLRPAAPLVNALVVLAKYPVIACAAAPDALWRQHDVVRAAPSLFALYVALCIHEALDDPILRRSLGRG